MVRSYGSKALRGIRRYGACLCKASLLDWASGRYAGPFGWSGFEPVSYLANQWNLEEPGQISVFSSKTLKPLVEKRLLV